MVGFHDFFSSCEDGSVFCGCCWHWLRGSLCKFYFIQVFLGDSDCACGESSKWDVVLFDELVKCGPADLEKFGSLGETEVGVLHEFLSSGFGDSPLFELENVLPVSCFSCNVGTAF